MPFWVVKFSVSPVMKPVLIVTVAPVRLPPLSTSVSVGAALEHVTAVPPPLKVGLPRRRDGRRHMRTSASVLVVLLVPLLVLPSVTVQLMRPARGRLPPAGRIAVRRVKL